MSIDLEFEDQKVKWDKPPSTFFHRQPDYLMRVTRLKMQDYSKSDFSRLLIRRNK
jgi:hypothetical protein